MLALTIGDMANNVPTIWPTKKFGNILMCNKIMRLRKNRAIVKIDYLLGVSM
jgi:hypothetical protein